MSTPEVMIVDDEPASVRLLTEVLRGAGFQVRPTTDGELALRSARVKLPDLILLDVIMPGLDGFEVCRRLKADKKTAEVPVIFVTARGDTADMVAAFRAGGADFVCKPFDPEEVLARVGSHLRIQLMQRELQSKNVELEQAREQLEEKVQERTAELENLNQVLEQKIRECGLLAGQRLEIISDLRQAQKEINILRGILPMCSYCKRIRSQDQQWEAVDDYIQGHSQADVSHSLCPECANEHYPEIFGSSVKKT